MVIKKAIMSTEVRSNLKGGEKEISFINHIREKMINCRLLAEMTIPIGGSIGEHTHINETEYYIIQNGEAIVLDNGNMHTAKTGDVIVTSHNESHSILNNGDSPLKITAIIVTH